MLVGVGGIGAIAGSLDTLVDESVGIIGRLDPVPLEPGAPDFFHFEARVCDAGALGGAKSGISTGAAAADRHAALTEAAAAGIARYAAALYERDALPLASCAEAGFPCVKPSKFALFSQAQYARAGFPYVPATDDALLRWAGAIDLATGETTHVPAAFVFHPFSYRRRDGDVPIAPPNAAGLACAEGIAEAALLGLMEIIRQDALALFWHGMTMPPEVAKETLPAPLRDVIGRFEIGGDRVVILDAASDNSVPTFVAILASTRSERPAYVLDGASHLDPESAIASALMKLADARRRSQDAMRRLVPVGPANEWEDLVDPVDHLLFAADHGNRACFEFAVASDLRRDFGEYESRSTDSVEADLETCVRLVAATGHHAYAANLTSDDIGLFGINVCRALIPGYLPLFAGHRLRALGGDRLYEVPQRLGYRGIDRGGTGNPAPHPFAC